MLTQSLSVGEAFAAMDAPEVALKHFDGSPLLTCTVVEGSTKLRFLKKVYCSPH